MVYKALAAITDRTLIASLGAVSSVEKNNTVFSNSRRFGSSDMQKYALAGGNYVYGVDRLLCVFVFR